MTSTLELNSINNGDSLKLLPLIPDNSIDLIITSPPYNVEMKYDVYVDSMPWPEYYAWCKLWLSECLRVLKPDGRMALNHYLSLGNAKERTAPLMELNQIALELGFKHHTVAVWTDRTLSRRTAWGCYDALTKVMTKRGFIFFKDVDIETDVFATMNTDGRMEWQKATDYICKPYNGNLNYIESRSISLAITPDHNMLYKNRNNSNILKIGNIDDITVNGVLLKKHGGLKDDCTPVPIFRIPKVPYGKRTKKVYISDDIDIDMNDWLQFLGIYLTDGNVYINKEQGTYTVSIYQRKPKFFKEISELMGRLPFKVTYKKSKDEFCICSKQLANYLYQFGNKNNRLLPDFIKDLAVEQKKLFIDWYFFGDGSYHKNGEKRYVATPSLEILKSLTVLLTECGYSYSISTIKSKNGKGMICGVPCNLTIDLHKINILNSEYYYHNRNHITNKHYIGNIYCVSVPNRTLLVERYGKICWCGNSWLSASSPYINSPFEGILILYKDQWKKAKKGVSDIPKEDFIQLTGGIWDMHPETKGITPAPFCVELPLKCIRLLSYVDSVILDPFIGSGTTAVACLMTGRKFIGIELSKAYCELAKKRYNEIYLENEIF